MVCPTIPSLYSEPYSRCWAIKQQVLQKVQSTWVNQGAQSLIDTVERLHWNLILREYLRSPLILFAWTPNLKYSIKMKHWKMFRFFGILSARRCMRISAPINLLTRTKSVSKELIREHCSRNCLSFFQRCYTKRVKRYTIIIGLYRRLFQVAFLHKTADFVVTFQRVKSMRKYIQKSFQ